MAIATHEASTTTIGLGTFISVQGRAPLLAVAQRGLSAALAAIACVDRLMHPERLGSDLRTIRDSPPHTPIRIHPWTHRVLSLSRQIHDASQGRFDPCLPQGGRLTQIDLLGEAGSDVAWVSVRAAVHLDLGGIAKGFAADRAIDALREIGCSSGLVNCGGDVAAFGPEEYPIACVDRHGIGVWVGLRDAALACSDVANPDRSPEHRGYYDGRNGSALQARHVVVTAPTAAVADALTKCLLSGVSGNVAAWLAQFGAEQILAREPPM